MKREAILNEEVKTSKERTKNTESEKITDKGKIIKAVFHFLFGFIAGSFPESYVVSPFSGAAVAAAQKGFAFFTFAGACTAYIIGRGFDMSVRYIVTLCFILSSRAVCGKRFISLDKTMISALFASIFTLLSDALDMLTVRVSLPGILFCFADALLCACSVYFFSKAFSVPVLKLGIRRISNYDAISICITAACLLSCIGRLTIAGFYVMHIPACLIIIFCAYYGKTSGGCVSGIFLALVLSISCGEPVMFYMYAIGGLFAGLLSFLGKYACAFAFGAAACTAAFIGGGEITRIPLIIQCIISSVIFMAITSGHLAYIEDILTKGEMRNDNEINMQVALNLKNAAKTVDTISGVVGEVSRKTEETVMPEISRIFARIQHNVCSNCANKGICWNESFDSTVKDVQQIAKMRTDRVKVTPEKLTGGLGERCIRLSKLCDEVDKDYRQYVYSIDSRLKTDEMRGVVSDQFSTMAQLLYDISLSVADEKIYDENKSRRIKTALREGRIPIDSAAYRENSLSRATVEILISEEPSRINSEKVRKIVSSALKKQFREAEISIEDMLTVLTFRQKNEYETSIGIKQIPCADNNVCGDCAATFDSQEGCTVAVISDGMGTGKRAAADAAMTSSIMNRLLSSGFTFGSALRLVNSALIIKSGEESLSTVDAVFINVYNAKVTFNKAGASASYIRNGDKVYIIEKPSLPVGILRNVDFAYEDYGAGDGDIILMMSDGVKGEDDGWIKETLLCWSTDNMQELATHIADMARMKNEKTMPDDITVIAIKIMKKSGK